MRRSAILDQAGEARRAFDPRIALACVALGAALFGGLVVLGGFGAPPPAAMAGADPRLTFILTPVFAAPLAAYGVWTGRLSGWRALGLIVGLTLVHAAAQTLAGINYLSPEPVGAQRLLDTAADRAFRAAHRDQMFATARYTAIRGGLAAGALGGGLSILLTAWCRRLKGLQVWDILAAIGLAGMAAFCLSDLPMGPWPAHLPHARPPLEWALRLFAPWQLLFGATMVMLLAREDPAPDPEADQASAGGL